MKLNYNIIWAEDKIETRPFQALVNNVKTFLKNEFFNVSITTAEDVEEFKEAFEADVDLVITDLNLNESLGSDIIDYIREEKNIMTEVFFYSANSELRSTELINHNRITFYQLNSQNLYRNLEREIINLIKLTIAKFQDIVTMRGIIMHETSSLDALMINIIKKAVKDKKTFNFNELANNIYDTIIRHFESKTNFVSECKEKSKFNHLIRDTFVFSSTYKIQTLSEILNSLELNDFSTEYKDEIISIRNKFAHAELLTNEEGEKYFQYGKDGLKFNHELCKKIRSDIQTHSDNLMGLMEKLNE